MINIGGQCWVNFHNSQKFRIEGFSLSGVSNWVVLPMKLVWILMTAVLANPACEIDSVKGQSCDDIKMPKSYAVGRQDGIYKIQLPGQKPAIVECVFKDGIGYTVIQKRSNGQLSFNRNWDEYKGGFSTWDALSDNCNVDEYWIGLQNIFQLSQKDKHLVIELERHHGADKATVEYSFFSITGARDNYRLLSTGPVQDYNNVGDAFRGADFASQGYGELDITDTNHMSMQFSTPDRDNDSYKGGNCAQQDSSGWWFNRCSAVNLNGKYYSNHIYVPSKYGYDDGILWQTWTQNKFESLTATKMMLGPGKPILN